MIVIEPPSSGSGDAAFDTLRKPELARFFKQAQRALDLRGEVTLLLADDARIRALNRSFRGKNKTTDVLSFPAAENGEGVVGDLAISVPVAAAQAAAHGHTLAEELKILALHGLLHLAGYDHEADTGEMRAREAELRTQFALPLSLIERTLSTAKAPAPKSTIAQTAAPKHRRAKVPAANSPAITESKKPVTLKTIRVAAKAADATPHIAARKPATRQPSKASA